MTSCIAIIPARGDSKRIPGKNVREFCGKPLLVYSIEAALETGIFERVIVSTDCEEIARVARKHGAETPFIRPENLADDHIGIGAAVDHAIGLLASAGQSIDYACCIFATAPLMKSTDLVRGLDAIKETREYSGSLSVTTFDFPVQRALRVDEHGALNMIQPEYQMTRSQDLEETYHDAGQFFWMRMENGKPASGLQKAVFVDRYRVQDIDTPEDWRMAECQYRALKFMEMQEQEHHLLEQHV